MKTVAFILTLSLTIPAFAAKFTDIKEMTSVPAQNLSVLVNEIGTNDEIFGDRSYTGTVAFQRKASEKNFNTTQQLSYVWGGATSDDSQVEFGNATTAEFMEFLFENMNGFDEEADEAQFTAGKARLEAAIEAVKADPNLEFYGSMHADEDGTWNIIYVVDKTHNEILMVSFGYSGT